jgi:hypothetical protein
MKRALRMRRGTALAVLLAALAVHPALGTTPKPEPPREAARSVQSVGVQATAPSVPQAIATPRPPERNSTQAVRGDAVQIEGKLYSPQAVYLLNRTAPHFGRDAVVPHTLVIGATTDLAPYRVRAGAVDAARPAGR